jgi:hypothetical protein
MDTLLLAQGCPEQRDQRLLRRVRKDLARVLRQQHRGARGTEQVRLRGHHENRRDQTDHV